MQQFLRGFLDVIQIKVRHLKTFARKTSMKYFFFNSLLQSDNESLLSELKIKKIGVTDFVSEMKRV